MAIASDGLPHQPGAPTWCILASLFRHLCGIEDPGRCANWFTASCGAVALGLLFYLTHGWCVRQGWAHRMAAAAGGLASVLLLARTPAFLEQSFMAEQYTLALCLFFALAIVAQRTEWGSSIQESRMTIAYFTMGLLWGLAVGNHLSQLVLGALPGLLLLHALWTGRFRWAISKGLAVALGVACGLMVFVWLPFRSHAKPLLDECHADSWDGFFAALGRGQWSTHPLSEAPRGFVGEWVASYDVWHQLGAPGTLLALWGLYLLLRRTSPLLVGMLLYVILYAVGMLVAHMRQDLITVDYIRQYGVMDWHLPLYATGAIAGGCTVAWLIQTASARWRPVATTGVCMMFLGLLLVEVAWAVLAQSLRGYQGARNFMDALLRPLPSKSVLLLSSDNVALMTTYEAWINQRGTNHWAAIDSERILRKLERASPSGDWNQVQLTAYLTDTLAVPGALSLNIPPLLPNESLSRRVFTEYSARHPGAATWLKPAGLLFEVSTTRVSNEDAGKTYRRDQETFPELFRSPPTQSVHRLEREAWALLHESRGSYFFARQMWPEAAASYALCVAWSGKTGSSWFCLATALENCGHIKEAENALIRAIDVEPLLEGPRINLAILQAQKGNLPMAQALLEEELRLDPGSAQARENLAVVQLQRAKQSTR